MKVPEYITKHIFWTDCQFCAASTSRKSKPRPKKSQRKGSAAIRSKSHI